MTGIDLVVPMVFPSDPAWQAAYNRAMGIADAPSASPGGSASERNVRYRSWQTEELLVRCCLKFMPWLNRIHLLLASETQVQPWMHQLIIDNGKLKIVFHRDFIPAQYLPTFNVNTIEMWLHRIPDLSEYFIYSNDDFFPLSPLQPEDFFQQRVGAPRDNDITTLRHNNKEDGALLPCQRLAERPYPTSPNIFHKFVKNGLDMVAADWGAKFGKTWLRTGHSMQPMLRSTVEHVCTKHADRILQSFTLKREPKNFNQYIFPFWQHLSGQYIDHVPPRRYVGPKVATRDVADILRDQNVGIVCLNDNGGIKDWEARAAIVRREIAAKLERPIGITKQRNLDITKAANDMTTITKSGNEAPKCSISSYRMGKIILNL